MKVIDLLNKIANGEIDEEVRYRFSPFDYYTIKEFFNRYVVDRENLNEDIIVGDKDIPLIPDDELYKIDNDEKLYEEKYAIDYNFKVLKEKINQVVEELNKRQ